MEILITQTRPVTKPIREYETRFIYVGFRFRYDSHTKTLSSIQKHPDGRLTYTESTSTADVFSRGYSSENTRVIIYSESPRIWVEETCPDEFFVFHESILQS